MKNKFSLIVSFFASISIYILILLIVLFYIFDFNKNILSQTKQNSIDVELFSSTSISKKNELLEAIETVDNLVNSSKGLLEKEELLSIRKVILETKLYTLDDKTKIDEVQNELKNIDTQIEKLTINYPKAELSKEEIKSLKNKYIREFLKYKPKEASRKKAIVYLKTKSLDELRMIGFFDNDEFYFQKESILIDWYKRL